MDGKKSLLGLDRRELEALVCGMGGKPSCARTIYRALYRRRQLDIFGMTDLSPAFQRRLAGDCTVAPPRIERVFQSADGTRRYRLKLVDGEAIEAIYIPAGRRWTICISTQVGCAIGCTFCVTATLGLRRHLMPGEIVGQILVVLNDLSAGPDGATRLNIVLMGMGEPLHNYDNTVKALTLMADEQGMGISPRRITLSTSGFVPALKKLAQARVVPNLAVSLHATTDAGRSDLIPINRHWNLQELLDACRAWPLPPRGWITFEYVLIAGVNDTPEDARRLVRLLCDQRAKVNLIPLNEDPALPGLHTSPESRLRAFQQVLVEHHLTVRVRRPRGLDIAAACGQLAARDSEHESDLRENSP